LLSLFADAFGVVDGDRLLTFLPFANYQQRMAYYFCLYNAIDFVCLPFPRLFAGLKKYKPTYVIAPPVFYEAAHNMAMVDVHSAQSGNAATTSGIGDRLRTMLGGNIRYMITGMAPIKRQTLDFFWKHGVALFEAFGITEAGMVTWNKPGHVKLGAVGKPAEPGSVTLSSEGEVIVTRDALLSLGYFDASDEDMRNTFVAENSVATGDIAEFDSDGFLTIIGRKKDAIITNSGEKFHPERIESLIQRESAVKTAVILGGQDLPCITAIVVVENKEHADVTDRIREQISLMNVELPVYQRVKKIVFTDADFTVDNGLRTKNMKLNRKAIYQSFFGSPSNEEQPVKGFANA
jgi:long-chain acyl-CoA synthetase